jgi:ethanolamine ammonia-lyase small subunit
MNDEDRSESGNLASQAPALLWRGLRNLTPARVALGRVGSSLPTRATLDFALDHARARDAVHALFDAETIAADLARLGLKTFQVASQASARALYLRRPDLGRRLESASRGRLRLASAACDIALVIGDGLSAAAAHNHAVLLIEALLPRLRGLRLGPAAIATGARVALGDEIGGLLKARLVMVLLGERPGLSAPDSLGVYLTYGPRIGRSDSERNCVSNIRTGGLSYAEAALKCGWLARQALAREESGIGLKEESGAARLFTDGSDPSHAPDT